MSAAIISASVPKTGSAWLRIGIPLSRGLKNWSQKIRLIFLDIRRRSKPHRKRQDCMRQSQSENAGSMDLRR